MYLAAFFTASPPAIKALGGNSSNGEYLIGLGIGDITGYILAHQGYAFLPQTDTGLHMRQRSRAFIVIDASNPSEHICMGDSSSRRTILSSLQSLYRDHYTPANTALVKTHAHSGSPLGYVNKTAAAIISSTLKVIADAHNSEYLANPEWERAMYEENQDTTVTVLGFENADGDAIKLLSFFPVHGTSLYGNNTLVSGDNKGMAAWTYKSEFPATTPLLQALEANVGDTTPNTQPCKFERSTCGNQTEDCHGWSNRIIGQAQFKATRTVVENSNMTTVSERRLYTFTLPNGTLAKTCPAALGEYFIRLLFRGRNHVSPCRLTTTSVPISTPGIPIIQVCQQRSAHSCRRQLWFVVSAMPGELTTMAGRRMRDALKARLIAEGVLDDRAYVVIVDPANTYGHYVTTREEYGVQRYDGASTIFGPATLDAYINKYSELVPYLAMNATWIPSSNAAPPELTNKAISLQTSVVVDNPPIFKHFGDVLIDVESGIYHAGDTVAVRFVGANPWNNLRLDGTFLTHFTNAPSSTNPATHQHWIHATRMLV
ncbi:Neutral/alkaline non-lysosomal ceramidase-domain-containing protein [Suillus cothurnatus]|nr:Neutral/alkaline non-lysosomal ceramidase-domain-containing protein [Suillus cothurnatus]